MAAHDALRTILPVAGLSPERAAVVEFTGGSDPILPTSFRISECAAGALAATGLAVSDLWELKTGRKQDVAVDARRATASLRSSHYLKVDGKTVKYDQEKTGYGWKTVAEIPAYVATQPTSCQMKRPN